MRPARIIATVIFAAAIAVTGCTTHATAVHPTAAPAPPVTAPPDTVVAAPTPKQLTRPVLRVPGPVLANGRYDAYIRTVDPSRNQLVVDLVQVFDGQAARDAAIADGMARDQAQYLGVYARNHQLTKLATHARSMSGPIHTSYFTLTVRAGAVHQVQEFLAINAC
jgi:hypothetical protein